MIKKVLEEREKTHGDYATTAFISQSIKQAMELGDNHRNDVARESLDMIATKLARIINGNWHEIDHWVDIIGYAQLVIDYIEKQQKRSQ